MFANWFDTGCAVKLFEEFLTVKGINCLQVGVYVGDASLWLLNNLECTLTDVDIWSKNFDKVSIEGVEAEYDRRLKGRATKIKGDSQEVLPTLPLESFDFIYIDGSHYAEAVYNDAIKAWPLLKKGGLMAFDDYNWHPYRGTDKHPKGGIDKFVEEYKPEIVHVGYQYWVRKPLCN